MTGITNINVDKNIPETKIKKTSADVPEQDFSLIFDQELGRTNEKLTANEKDLQEKKAKKDDVEDTPDFNPGLITALFNELKLEKKTSDEDHFEKEVGLPKNNKNFSNNVIIDNNNKNNPSVPVSWKPVLEEVTEKLFAKLDISKLLALTKGNISLDKFILPEQSLQTTSISFSDLYDQLLKEVNKKSSNLTRIKLALEPESLGKIDIFMFLDKNKLYISFAANEETKKLLMDTKDNLIACLNKGGYELADMNFSSYNDSQGAPDQNFSEVAQKNDYNLLNIIDKKDIISGVNNLLSSIIVNYIA